MTYNTTCLYHRLKARQTGLILPRFAPHTLPPPLLILLQVLPPSPSASSTSASLARQGSHNPVSPLLAAPA